MPNELIKFWRKLNLTSQPFAHPDDSEILRQNGAEFNGTEPGNFETYIGSSLFGRLKSDDKRLHLSLLPTPYMGDITHAEIVILSSNPGVEHTDYWAENKMPPFQRRLEGNLQQSFEGVESPFLFLDPEFCWHTGFMYWEERLREVIRLIADKRFDKRYIEGLRDLSRRLACVELIPYHSVSFVNGLIGRTPSETLPSANKALDFARTTLLQDTVEGRRTLVVPRKTEKWGIPAPHEHLVIYPSEQAQTFSLKPNSPGGKAILRRYGIDSAESIERN